MTKPHSAKEHCPECLDLFRDIDAKIDDLNVKADDVYNTLTGGDPLHPNGLRDQVNRNAEGLSELQSEWREFKAQARTFGAVMAVVLPFGAALLTRWIA